MKSLHIQITGAVLGVVGLTLLFFTPVEHSLEITGLGLLLQLISLLKND